MPIEKLSQKDYSRIEIAKIMDLNSHDKNFANKVKSRLNKWGYTYDYSSTKVSILKVPETPKEKLTELLIRKFDLDIQIDIDAFAVFVYALAIDLEFASSPWDKRETILRTEYGVTVAESTLRRWASILIENEVITKDKYTPNLWRSYREFYGNNIYGLKQQERIDINNKEDYQRYLDYQSTKFEILKKVRQYYKDNNIKANPWKEVFNELWNTYHCCYYNVKQFQFGAFYDEDDIWEILELTEQIFINLPPKEEQIFVSKNDDFVF